MAVADSGRDGKGPEILGQRLQPTTPPQRRLLSSNIPGDNARRQPRKPAIPGPGPALPIGAGMGLIQLHAKQLLHQRRVTNLTAVAQRQRRQLGIEHGSRHSAAQVIKEFQILLRGMQHFGDGRVVEKVQQGVQRRQRQGIDAGHPVDIGDLDQSELWIESLLADEFGIQRQPDRAAQAGAEIGQSGLIDDI